MKHINTGGYKAMLRDRIPSTIDIALKFCKAKQRWVDYVYDEFIHPYTNNSDKSFTVKHILGETCRTDKHGNKHIVYHVDFHHSINWDELSPSYVQYWQWVETWVLWLQKNLLYIQNNIESLRDLGYTEEQITSILTDQYSSALGADVSNKLIKFLIRII